jgi:hypothetical protein
MTFTISVIVAAALAGATIGALAVLVTAIRADDRAQNLRNAPRTNAEALTRRVLGVGVRTSRPGHDGTQERGPADA